jgi:prepilin-type N-terminal cleavage/methylation domain-containing protein
MKVISLPCGISFAVPTNGFGTSNRLRSRANAFTLIELLIVISIIAILAGLAFPAVNGAIESGKKAQARNDVNQIASAIRNFKLEYKRLPTPGTEIPVILGENVDGQNPKNLVLLEPKNAKGDPPKGGYRDGEIYDPWGQSYEIILDDDYDNKIEHNGETFFTQVIVESKGGAESQKNRKPINNVQ